MYPEGESKALEAAKRAAGIEASARVIGGMPVFERPEAGWVDLNFAGYRYHASYITSIMTDALDALAGYFRDGTGHGFQVNCEDGGESIIWLEGGYVALYDSLGWTVGFEEDDMEDVSGSDQDDDAADGSVASLRGSERSRRYVGDAVLRGIATQVLLDVANHAEDWCDWNSRDDRIDFAKMRHRCIRGVRNLADALGLSADTPERILPMVALKSADYADYSEWHHQHERYGGSSLMLDDGDGGYRSLNDILDKVCGDDGDDATQGGDEGLAPDDGDEEGSHAGFVTDDLAQQQGERPPSRRVMVLTRHEEGTNPMSNAYGIDTQIGDEGEFRSIAGPDARVLDTPAYGWAHMLVCGACLPVSYVGCSNPAVATMKAVAAVLEDGKSHRIEIDGEDAGFWTVVVSPGRIAVYEYTDDEDGREPVREQAATLDGIRQLGIDVLGDVTRDAVAWLSWNNLASERGHWMEARFERDKNQLLGAIRSLTEALGTPEGKSVGQGAIEAVYDVTVEQIIASPSEE